MGAQIWTCRKKLNACLVEEEDFTSNGGHLVQCHGIIWTNCQYRFDRRPHVKSGEIVGAVAEKKTFKNYTILFMNIAKGQFNGVETFEQIVKILSVEGPCEI